VFQFLIELKEYQICSQLIHRRPKLTSREKRKINEFSDMYYEFIHESVKCTLCESRAVWCLVILNWRSVTSREEPLKIWTIYKGMYWERNTVNYEHFTRKINKTYSFLVCPLWFFVISADLGFLCHHCYSVHKTKTVMAKIARTLSRDVNLGRLWLIWSILPSLTKIVCWLRKM